LIDSNGWAAPTPQHRHAQQGARDAVGREDAHRLLAELGEVKARLDDLKRRLRGLAEES
jgi:hypothetical protein